MLPDIQPRKTATAHVALAQRQPMSAALRMLLITINGQRSVAELSKVACGLGLSVSAFERLREAGLIVWDGFEVVERQQAEQERNERARRLVRAKYFALDLAARMLAGRDGALREKAREADSESRFAIWLDECAAAITDSGSVERAALFRERVAAAACG